MQLLESLTDTGKRLIGNTSIIIEDGFTFFGSSIFTQHWLSGIKTVQLFNMAPAEFHKDSQSCIVAVWRVKLKH